MFIFPFLKKSSSILNKPAYCCLRNAQVDFVRFDGWWKWRLGFELWMFLCYILHCNIQLLLITFPSIIYQIMFSFQKFWTLCKFTLKINFSFEEWWWHTRSSYYFRVEREIGSKEVLLSSEVKHKIKKKKKSNNLSFTPTLFANINHYIIKSGITHIFELWFSKCSLDEIKTFCCSRYMYDSLCFHFLWSNMLKRIYRSVLNHECFDKNIRACTWLLFITPCHNRSYHSSFIDRWILQILRILNS